MKAITCDVGPGRASCSSQGAAPTLGANWGSPRPYGAEFDSRIRRSSRGNMPLAIYRCPYGAYFNTRIRRSSRGNMPLAIYRCPYGAKAPGRCPVSGRLPTAPGSLYGPGGAAVNSQGRTRPWERARAQPIAEFTPRGSAHRTRDYASSEMPRILPETWWSDDALPGSRCIA